MTTTAGDFSKTLSQVSAEPSSATDYVMPASVPHFNTHIHLPPNFSAFDTTSHAVDLAASEDVRVLGASNYYDYTVYRNFADQATSRGIFPLFGLEIIALIDSLVAAGIRINDPGNPGKMYICGKALSKLDPMSEGATVLLQTIRGADSARLAIVVEKLAETFVAAGLDTGLDAEAVKDRIVARHDSPRASVYLQERHVAQAFQEVLFERVPVEERTALLARIYQKEPKSSPTDAVGTQNEIRSHVMKAGKPAYVPDTFVDFDHAHSLILALGGIPSYPVLIDGAQPICEFERTPEELIAELQGLGFHAVELIPIRNSPEMLEKYVRAFREAGLVVTAGTEHNTLDLIPIAPTCAGGAPIPAGIQQIFWEGACVLAAHQYLTLQGKPGFVDENGAPNRDYRGADERIEAFQAIGAAVIDQFRQISQSNA